MLTLPLPWPDTHVLLAPPWPHLGVWRWPLLAAVALVPLGLIAWLYRAELRVVSRSAAFALLMLRLTTLGLLIGLVCLQPVYARDVRHEHPGRVIVAIDRSASMGVSDPQRPMDDKLRLARAMGLLDGVPASLVEKWIEEVAQRREPTLTLPGESEEVAARRWKAFSDAVAAADGLTRAAVAKHAARRVARAVEGRHTVEMLDDATDPAFTDLGAALLAAQKHGRGEVVGVVLITDGQHNSGPAPGRLARQLGEVGVPVFPVAVGHRLPPPDAAVVELRGPPHNVFRGVEALLTARVRVAGLPAGEYAVELREDGRKDELTPPKVVQHDGTDRTYDLTFAVTMSDVGPRTLTATVTPPDGVKDTLSASDRLPTTVMVADDRVKLLLADGTARWEYHYLATMLRRDRLIDLTAVVFDQPRVGSLDAEQATAVGLPGREWPKDDLSAFGCVVVGDVDAERLTLAQRQRLERFVAEGGGTLIVVAGKKAMPLGFPAEASDPLRRLLPVEGVRELAPEAGFGLSLTRAGRDTKFMELDADADENEALWAGHPRPWGWAAAGGLKPGATALAGWRDPADEKVPVTERERKNVVVARHNYGFGRVLYVGVDATWRWRFRAGDLYHHRFWGQVIRWAAADRPLAVGNEWLRFGTGQPTYRAGEEPDVTVRFAEKAGELPPGLLAGARVIALGDPEKSVGLVPLSAPEGRPRERVGKLGALPPGRYAVELAVPDMADRLAGEDGKPLRAAFTVVPPDSQEMLRLETNAALLDDIAVSSGGRVFGPGDVDALGELLAARGRVEVERVPTKLYQWWPMLAAVVALLTAEWLVRKAAWLP